MESNRTCLGHSHLHRDWVATAQFPDVLVTLPDAVESGSRYHEYLHLGDGQLVVRKCRRVLLRRLHATGSHDNHLGHLYPLDVSRGVVLLGHGTQTVRHSLSRLPWVGNTACRD